MTPVVHVGQLEITANGDLVTVLHREPIQHEVSKTFAGRFDSVSHWTPMTPKNARIVAAALIEIADFLDRCSTAKGLI